MTVIEMKFMEQVPALLKQIAEELKKINETLKNKDYGTQSKL